MNYSTWCTQIGLLSKQLISNLIVFAEADCNQGTVSNGSVTLQQIKFGSKNDYICHFFRNYEAKHKSKHLACNLMQTCINLTYFSWIYNQKMEYLLQMIKMVDKNHIYVPIYNVNPFYICLLVLHLLKNTHFCSIPILFGSSSYSLFLKLQLI